ncbi:MAG: gamma-glutamyl-gamma-aminobutyrate hydrolase family protein [Clostridia bacterium]|nr:gamma-glutamyl-gamma-aminobutyrate hydrolase family protein [Clostridia bacterium]
MMRMIGVTPSQDEKGRIFINHDYLDAVARSGALPVLLPLTDDAKLLDEMLKRVDALLLSGGADVGPDVYGEENLPLCGETAPVRDRMEVYLCKAALEKDMPILAICRGHQILNCALGGTLYQDIRAQYGEQLRHPCYEAPRDQVHTVTVAEGTLLRRVTGMESMQVNSRHHQAVKDLGQGLAVNARATDGLIEGIELPGKKFVLGVQWHPESLSDYREEAQKLFNALAEACR